MAEQSAIDGLRESTLRGRRPLPAVSGAAGVQEPVAGLVERARALAAEHGGPALAYADGPGGVLSCVWANGPALDLLGARSAAELDLCRSESAPASPGRSDTDSQEGDPSWSWRQALATCVVHGLAGAAGALDLPDGRPVGLRLAVSVLPGKDRAVGWVVGLNPTTPAVEAALLRAQVAEHRLMTLSQHAPVGIFLSEAGVRLGYVNEVMSELTGRSAEHLVGTGWLDCVHPGDAAILFEALQDVLSGQQRQLDVRLVSVRGPLRWVQLRIAPTTTQRRAAGFVGTCEDITARRAWEEQLTWQATHDPLTGLANRRRLMEVLNGLLHGSRVRDRRFALLFCDLDGFKAINDQLGHDAGDRVLIEVARRLNRSAREHDLTARVAGDEFVLVLRHIADPQEAVAVAGRHLQGLGERFRVAGQDVRISASLGIAIPGESDTPDSLLRAADRVMYEAKASGPGRFRMVVRDEPAGGGAA